MLSPQLHGVILPSSAYKRRLSVSEDVTYCEIVLNGVSGQDFADHKARYTEPNTGITFWTAYQANGTVEGDGEFSTVSLGGYAFGIALPENAATVNSYEYIGMLVSSSSTFKYQKKRTLSLT